MGSSIADLGPLLAHLLQLGPAGFSQSAIVDENIRFRRIAQVGESLHGSIYKETGYDSLPSR